MNPTVCWPDKTLPVEIYCAPGVLTSLEMLAADGLLAIPRIGLGVGGLLLGRRAKDRIDILKTVEIPCSHALGPAFILTPEEMNATSELPAAEEKADTADQCELVGWYCSKPSFAKTPPPMALTEHDQMLFDALCTEAWQVALLIRPIMGRATLAAFGFRSTGEPGNGCVLGETRELAWQELAAYEEPLPAQAAATPVTIPVAIPVTTPVDQIREADPEPPEPHEIPVTMPRSGTLFGASGEAPEDSGPRRWPLRFALILLLLAILSGAAFFTRGYWMPRPPIALVASSDWTGRVAVLWNSEALSGQDQVTLVIDDGSGPLHTIHLTHADVLAGVSQYHCRPGHVNVTLLAGDLSDTAATTVKATPADVK